MSLRLILFVVVSAGAVSAAGTATPCDRLIALTIPDATIRSAALVPAGPFPPPGASSALILPRFCRVEAVAHPVTDSQIYFELWMPPAAEWNGKFQGVGNGGYSGALSYTAMANALRLGYAVASHDTGHSGAEMSFGQRHPEKVKDYAYRAAHVMTDLSKLLVRVHMGKLPERSYFVGCSAGGHQALSEAQRYPDDYDGIIAGAPASNRIRQTFGFLWAWMAMHPEGSLILPAEKLSLVTKAAIRACDASDGLKDGLIADPRRCRFDPASLLCKGGDSNECLTAPQVDAVRKVYEGPKDPKTGTRIFSGFSKGSEDTLNQSWRPYILNPPEPMRVDLFRFFLFHDPNWDFRTIDWARDLAYADQKLGFLSATKQDLTPFEKRGGKLLMYGGWADPVVAPEDTALYYEGVTKTMGGPERTSKFARLFMAPGMGHCGGGIGPNQFDALTALDEWVTKGKAPEKLVATLKAEDKVVRTRPLCPYPQVAKYKGSGSIDDAANFACAAPKP